MGKNFIHARCGVLIAVLMRFEVFCRGKQLQSTRCRVPEKLKSPITFKSGKISHTEFKKICDKVYGFKDARISTECRTKNRPAVS